MIPHERSDSVSARPRPLMSIAEASRELGIGTTTGYEWARRNELPGLVRHGGRLYVRRAVLTAYLAGQDVGIAPGATSPDVPLDHPARRDGRAVKGGANGQR